MKTNVESSSNFNPVSFTVLVVLLAVSAGLYSLKLTGVPILVTSIIISFLIASSIHIADQWEKAVVLRMGKYRGLRGPGLFFIIPIIDQINSYIDQRVRVTEFRAGFNIRLPVVIEFLIIRT